LGKLGVGAAGVAPEERTPWVSAQARGIVLFWLMLIGISGLVVWRTWEMRGVLKTERDSKVLGLAGQAAQLRKDVEAARVYASWLGSQAGEKTAAVVAAGGLPASAATSTGSPLLYKAKADMMQGVLRDLDVGLTALEREAAEGQEKTFEKLKKKAFDPGFEVFKNYTSGPQIDGRDWRVIEATLRPAAKTTVNLNADAKASAGGRADLDIRNSSGTPPPNNVAESPIWDPNMAVFLTAMGFLLLAIFRAKDNYVVQPTPEYEDAVRVWQAELLRNPETASPRELKRFMNLSRYAVARLQSSVLGGQLPISETCVVELSAKWLSIPQSASNTNKLKILRKNGASKEEVALFLEIVGDVGEGGRDSQSA
jgi:hypothetical protein